MTRRLAALLPLAFALGCGAAPPPAAPPPPAAAEASGAAAAPQAPAQAPQAPAAPAAKAAAAADAAAPAPTSVAKATAALDAPLVGTITQDAVIAQVAKHSDQFNRCYSIGAGASKTWRAKVTIKATVGPSGNVGAVDVLSSTAKNPKVDACVAEAFKKLVFPRPKGAGATTFTFPLSFDGVEQVQ